MLFFPISVFLLSVLAVWTIDQLTESSLREEVRLNFNDAYIAVVEDYIKSPNLKEGTAIVIVTRRNSKTRRIKVNYQTSNIEKGQKIHI